MMRKLSWMAGAAVLVMAGHEDGVFAYGPDPQSARDALWDVYCRARRE